MFTIETAIWINLSVPYFTGSALSFVGYLIINTVQLGATVDYAILFTKSYLDNRETLYKKDAMRTTIDDNLEAILISAGILSTAGFALALTSSNPAISDLGMLLGRDAALCHGRTRAGAAMLFDRIIRKTTLKQHEKVKYHVRT